MCLKSVREISRKLLVQKISREILHTEFEDILRKTCLKF